MVGKHDNREKTVRVVEYDPRPVDEHVCSLETCLLGRACRGVVERPGYRLHRPTAGPHHPQRRLSRLSLVHGVQNTIGVGGHNRLGSGPERLQGHGAGDRPLRASSEHRPARRHPRQEPEFSRHPLHGQELGRVGRPGDVDDFRVAVALQEL